MYELKKTDISECDFYCQGFGPAIDDNYPCPNKAVYQFSDHAVYCKKCGDMVEGIVGWVNLFND
jgi:hypothetical protein